MTYRATTRIPVLVIYDIPHDGTRGKVADCCLDYGLDRIQYSAFVGELSRTHQEELFLRIKRRVGKRAAKVHIVVISTDDWARRLVVEQGDATGAPMARVTAPPAPRLAGEGRVDVVMPPARARKGARGTDHSTGKG